MNLSGLPENKLTEIEEQKLAKMLPNNAAEEKLVMHSMREAFLYATGVSKGGISEEEVFSLSYEALSKAVKNFKPGQQRFFAYAKCYIRGCIYRAWREKDIVKNASMHEDREYIPKNPPKKNQCNFIYHDCPEFALGELDQPTESLEVGPDYNKIHWNEQWEFVKPIINKHLTEQEKLILELFYSGDLNFRKISQLLGMSRSAVQATHMRALKKIRVKLMEESKLFNR